MAYGFNNDKSKVEIYSKTEVDSEIDNVNDRIDNIITSPAPTEQEIIDARLGTDGVTYPSLGDAIRDQVSDLKSDIDNINDVLEMPLDESHTASCSASWTPTTIGSFNLKAGVTYNFRFSVPSATGATTYINIKDPDNTSLISAQLLGTDTYIDRTYTPTNDITVYASFQIGTTTLTTVTCRATSTSDNVIEKIEQSVSDLEDLLITEAVITKKATSISGVTGKKVYFNSQYSRVALSTDAGLNVHVYQVKDGDICKITGRGNNSEAQPIAVVGNEDIVTTGDSYCTLLQSILADSSTIDTYTVEAEIEDDGYLYVNYDSHVDVVIKTGLATVPKTDITLSDPALPANAKAVGDAVGISGVIKNSGAYTFIGSKGKEKVGLTFKRIGGNSLLDWDVFAFGSFDGSSFIADDTIFDAYTDITGPFSIGQNSSQGGSWAGGYHTKTVSGVACPTAEQTDLKVYVDGSDITSEADGFYSGDVVIETTNIIYFPQTIIDNAFTDAVPAIEEKRRYSFENSDVHVQVIAKTLASVYFSLYYGMQMQSAWATKFIIPSSDAMLAKTDITSDTDFADLGHLIINESSDARLAMQLDDNGIGTFKYNNEVSDNKIHLMSGGAKSYFIQIRNKTIPSGTYLYWDGVYKISRA